MNAIKDFEGLYSICESGEIFSHRSDKNLKPQIHSGGYRTVTLYKSKKKYMRYVHRLVAEHFIPNPEGLPQVGHKGDEDKANNSMDNLYWCSGSANIKDAHKNGRMSKRVNFGSTTHQPVDTIKDIYRCYLKTGSITKAAKKFGVSRTTLSSIVNKRSRVKITDQLDKEVLNQKEDK